MGSEIRQSSVSVLAPLHFLCDLEQVIYAVSAQFFISNVEIIIFTFKPVSKIQ